MRAVLLATAATLAAAAPAAASNPASGTGSSTSPTVSWQGNAAGYGVVPTNLLLTGAGLDPVCPPAETGTCDTFALHVADSYDLAVTAECVCSNNFMELHVHKPDGTMEYFFSDQGAPAEIDIPAAAVGDYTVDVLTNDAARIQSGAYFASATLAVP
jgi:hypothetical protein